eukprot:TRINITY_DN3174_c0_g1_i1.p3 TRINITY_DN3174_c0_g1~~TRINITY_DN3174_c0_g1_i1.p3  ORF type:complete len:104 (+),score=30.55 TRINITY_DN3174_c0_g1_i1:189-500(+)
MEEIPKTYEKAKAQTYETQKEARQQMAEKDTSKAAEHASKAFKPGEPMGEHLGKAKEHLEGAWEHKKKAGEYQEKAGAAEKKAKEGHAQGVLSIFFSKAVKAF